MRFKHFILLQDGIGIPCEFLRVFFTYWINIYYKRECLYVYMCILITGWKDLDELNKQIDNDLQ